jgi:hypothetical protein
MGEPPFDHGPSGTRVMLLPNLARLGMALEWSLPSNWANLLFHPHAVSPGRGVFESFRPEISLYFNLVRSYSGILSGSTSISSNSLVFLLNVSMAPSLASSFSSQMVRRMCPRKAYCEGPATSL